MDVKAPPPAQPSPLQGLGNSGIFILEAEIRKVGEGMHSAAVYTEARDALVNAIAEVCHLPGLHSGANLERVLGKVESATFNHRIVAILLIRCMAIDGLLPIDDEHNVIIRKILAIIESHTPELMKHCRVDRQQNFEKINIIKTLHGTICAHYSALSQVSGSLNEIASQKSLILKCLRHNTFQGYLQPFNYVPIKTKLEALAEGLDAVINSSGSDYKLSLDELERILDEGYTLATASQSFFTEKFALPFLSAVKNAVELVKTTASERLASVLEPIRKPPKAAEKRYPLHQVDRFINIILPLVNKGPSTAVEVIVEIDCGTGSSVILENDRLRCGDVPPGKFAVCLRACVIEPSTKVEMTVDISWRELFGTQRSEIFDLVIEGQNEAVDWASLESLEPYSLEVAEGDMFVGRSAKVKAIANKLLKHPMTSTYVTGQKRIGKTSLAKAVVNYLERDRLDFHSLYLEYGEYCSTSPQGTLKALGENIHTFLLEYMPASDAAPADFRESIADLNLTAKKLETRHPNKKFVIILDEFDEIHPEMYRSGPVAETFFANLRTLAARKNLAFILVGGEKMPFIIGAQGDQLNKFSRETLDYFSRSTEWAEYLELITKPVEGKLNWDDEAINQIFTLTHGHPYYTKLLCSKIVSIAIAERDTEIIASDVTSGLPMLLAELDTNAFAHLWKDGISFEREHAEVAELKRLRLLVGIGRSLREHKRREEDVKARAVSAHLLEHEITPLIADFQRREILYERNGDLYFTVPLFEHWLTEYGLNKLVTSTLGDELEESIKVAEDKAHVTAKDIQTLVTQWPIYRAQKVDGEQIRAWLDQEANILNQRLLFLILENIRFINPVEIEEYLKTAHARIVRPAIGVTTITRRTDRRNDVFITFVDGVGKSGLQYARTYAKTNSLSAQRILEPTLIGKRLAGAKEEGPPKAIIIVDDVIGSGDTLSGGLTDLLDSLATHLLELDIPILIISLIGTEEGEKKVKSTLDKYGVRYDLYLCEILSPSSYAFPAEGHGFWETEEQMHKAKALCLRLGTSLYKHPLGFKNQGLLLVLPETCPNNSLPILYRAKVGAWTPLFPRPAT
ncbi:ATP-binding protein [Pseudomonas syringae]|uniref:phosphoribosyltransferase-like protein n=1 Tax=Pseudomonas syringae TaxID=317 RepID=UPI002249365F|nr:ATP-binding protein [Pseudomonas syringae]UZS67891.1 ATP-binding protein [Pseudomonas syringae]